MPVKLRPLISALFPPTRGTRLLEVSVEKASVQLQLTVTAPTAACPRCAVSSSSVHSRYQRHLTDLPWGTCAVRIQLTVRKFRCRNRGCRRRIFTERLPDLVAAYGRHTHRLATALRSIGLALGGNPGGPNMATACFTSVRSEADRLQRREHLAVPRVACSGMTAPPGDRTRREPAALWLRWRRS
jgi:zinc-finger of transposase IS204/IS1001/IS1096/IS1165